MRPVAALVLVSLSLAPLDAMRLAAAEAPDVLRYDLEVALRERGVAVTATIHAAGSAPSKWSLDLAPEMKVLSAEAGGMAVPCAASGAGVVLDLSAGSGASGGEFAVTLRVAGSPLEENRSMGVLRSAIRPDCAWIRSQHAWYPRVADDPALYRTVVDAPMGWQVRTAGAFTARDEAGGRVVWTFETKEPVGVAGLVAGPWKCVERSGAGLAFDALFAEGHGKGAEALLDAARRAFEFYGDEFGSLGWTRLSLVEMPKEFGPSSGYCEHGYVLLGPEAFEPAGAGAWIPQGIAHEVSHSWWAHGVLFSDFASESLAEFSSLLFLRASEGEDAARRMREAAVVRVAASAAAGKETALADIRGWGAGMDPGTYRAHAYEKTMMILAMIEKAAGPDAMRGLLARFFRDHRGDRVGWADLRRALAGAGPGARRILEQWERPGIPTIVAECAKRKAGSTWVVEGRLSQEGTERPFSMDVPILADCEGKPIASTIRLTGASAPFTLKAPAEPGTVTVDPDWLVLAARRSAGSADPAKDFDEGIAVANDPGEADPGKLEEAIGKLRRVLAAGQQQGACHVGIGRCLFREGKIDEAKEELEAGLRIGGFGPFNVSWAHLRLGCIADLRKKRDEAVSHYKAVLALPDAANLKFQKGKAQAFFDRPYRGYKVDG